MWEEKAFMEVLADKTNITDVDYTASHLTYTTYITALTNIT
jgi:hypothetical protein